MSSIAPDHVSVTTPAESAVGSAAAASAPPPIINPHIRLDEQGRAWITDTQVKVIEVALDMLAHGLSPEEIYVEHYRGISLAKIHAALAWYYDHQTEYDAEIARQSRDADRMRQENMNSPVRQKLRRLGLIP